MQIAQNFLASPGLAGPRCRAWHRAGFPISPLAGFHCSSLWSADACALRLLSRGREAHARDGGSMKPRPSGRGFSLQSVQRARFHMQRAAPSDPKKRAPPQRRCAEVRQALPRRVVQSRAFPDADGQSATNDGSSPTSRSPCPDLTTPRPLNSAPMREGRSSLFIRN